jgi:hypothetical protein
MIRATNGNRAVAGPLRSWWSWHDMNANPKKKIFAQRRKGAKVGSDLFQDPFDP